MANKLEVINGALAALKTEGVSSEETEGNAVYTVISTSYDEIVDREFRHNWLFATRATQLQQVLKDDEAVLSPYEVSWVLYEIPVKTITLKNVFRGRRSQEEVEYKFDMDGIHSAIEKDLYATFIQRIDEEKWPADFVRQVQLAIACFFAYKHAPTIADKLKEDYMMWQANAVSSDYQQQGLHNELMNDNQYKRRPDGLFGDRFDRRRAR